MNGYPGRHGELQLPMDELRVVGVTRMEQDQARRAFHSGDDLLGVGAERNDVTGATQHAMPAVSSPFTSSVATSASALACDTKHFLFCTPRPPLRNRHPRDPSFHLGCLPCEVRQEDCLLH